MTQEQSPRRIGFIGLDTSHVEAFARLLMDETNEHHVSGGKVVIAMPGGSPDFELSHSRVPGFTEKLRDQFGVQMVDTPEAVAEACDLLFIESVDGRVHREQFERTIKFGKPTFIDKPFATTSADAQVMVDLAAEHGVPLMSCSSLRYADNFQAALADGAAGEIVGIDTAGPMAIQPTQPSYFWYGIHCFEMIVAAMGVGCRRVTANVIGDHDMVTAEWDDGRVATYRGLSKAHSKFTVALHRERDVALINASDPGRPYYASLLEAILHHLPHGRSAIPSAEMLEVVRVIEAANASRETEQVVELDGESLSSGARQ
ncbi:Gfo/Idh/MocA family protein [Phycisphaerales bacterium AB-hyl4]|uniref:Gfo/Idh/MocA family protein n=1 Tax=Natronomicrosphaera hydrolytica TaxID=3242702 RepID=A0ABV4UB34_9BACT